MKLRDENNPNYDVRFYGCNKRFWRRDIIDFKAPKTESEKAAVLIDGAGRWIRSVGTGAGFAFFTMGTSLVFIDPKTAAGLYAVSAFCSLSGLGFRCLARSWAVLKRGSFD